MNAGMYGMADGRGGQFPKAMGVAGKNLTPSGLHNITSLATSVGASVNTVATSNGVRVKGLNINGRGFFKLLTGGAQSTSTPVYRVELVLDGVRVLDVTWSGGGLANVGPPMLGGFGGNTSSPAPFFEPLPFSSSAEVFVTMSGVGDPLNMVYLADIYQ